MYTLYEWLRLNDAEGIAKKASKQIDVDLMQKVAGKYPTLDEEDCKSLLINDKWYSALDRSIDNETNRIIRVLSSRVKMIGERYASTLSDLENEVEEYSQKVKEHLKKMGIEEE